MKLMINDRPRNVPRLSGFGRVNPDRLRPAAITGIETTKLAAGPAKAISNSTFRLGTGSFNLMNAPKVPISVGAGMKWGSVALIR